ncbi:MAG: M48 family metallopeptidase [Trueperaceae bacterium]|nr:M48 family metallopeptidase [Trueperaceae bacterium]
MSSAAQKFPTTISLSGQRINLLAWQARNRRNSVLLGLGVFALLALIAYLAAIALSPENAFLFVAIALLVGGVQNGVAYWFGDQIALNVSGARPANIEEHRYLVNVTEAVAIGAGVPMPKLYVIDSPAPNAFATGRNPEHGSIAVTTGLLKLLDRQELEGVIAHEMSHIKNYDMLMMSMIAATIGALVILRDVIWRSRRYGNPGFGGSNRRRDSNDQNGNAQMIAMLILFILLILAPIFATLLRYAISRKREFLADATAVYITRNPEGMASALERLRDYRGEELKVSEGVQHLFFTNPVRNLNAESLMATHPPLEERIRRIRQLF